MVTTDEHLAVWRLEALTHLRAALPLVRGLTYRVSIAYVVGGDGIAASGQRSLLPNMRRILVTHHGVPVGRVEALRLTSGDLAVGELECMSTYDALRPTIWEASRSLWSVGFLASGVDVTRMSPAPAEVRERAAELELELHDEYGTLVPTDFVNIVERPFVEMPPVVLARLRLAPAAETALAIPGEASDPDRSK